MNGPIILGFIIAIIVLATKYPTHAKKVFAGLSKAVAAGNGTPATPSQGGGSSQKALTIIISIAALLVVGFGLYSPKLGLPRPSDVGDWSEVRWLWLLILWALIAGLIAINSTWLEKLACGTSKMLQKVLAGVMLVLIIGLPAGTWVKDLFLPKIICKDASANETRSCNLNTAWSTWIKFAEGPAANGMRLCISPGAKFEREEMGGTTFWHFKSEKNRLLMRYRLIPGSEKCPDVL